MIFKHFNETLSIYCGGFDNLFRHHDYTRAILESIWPYPMARYWLHCYHLYLNGRKMSMSKSRGNIYYTDTLLEQGFETNEIRFFLIYGHYRQRLNYSDGKMRSTVNKLRRFRQMVDNIESKAGQSPRLDGKIAPRLKGGFAEKMDDDLDVRAAFDGLYEVVSGVNVRTLEREEASGIIGALRAIDDVLRIIF